MAQTLYDLLERFKRERGWRVLLQCTAVEGLRHCSGVSQGSRPQRMGAQEIRWLVAWANVCSSVRLLSRETGIATHVERPEAR